MSDPSRVVFLESYINGKEARESNSILELATAVTKILEISNGLDGDIRTIKARAKYVSGSKTETEVFKENYGSLRKFFSDSYLVFLDENGFETFHENPPLNFSVYRNAKLPKPEVVESFEKNLDRLVKLIDECRSLGQTLIEKKEVNNSRSSKGRTGLGVNRLSEMITRVLNDDRYSQEVKDIFFPILEVLN